MRVFSVRSLSFSCRPASHAVPRPLAKHRPPCVSGVALNSPLWCLPFTVMAFIIFSRSPASCSWYLQCHASGLRLCSPNSSLSVTWESRTRVFTVRPAAELHRSMSASAAALRQRGDGHWFALAACLFFFFFCSPPLLVARFIRSLRLPSKGHGASFPSESPRDAYRCYRGLRLIPQVFCLSARRCIWHTMPIPGLTSIALGDAAANMVSSAGLSEGE